MVALHDSRMIAENDFLSEIWRLSCLFDRLANTLVQKLLFDIKVLKDLDQHVCRQLVQIINALLHLPDHRLKLLFHKRFLAVLQKPFNSLGRLVLFVVNLFDCEELNDFERPRVRIIR